MVVITGPENAMSILGTVCCVLSTITSIMMVIPFISSKNNGIRQAMIYPNMYIPAIGVGLFLTNLGFWIGFLFDFNPSLYPHELCIVQWVFLGWFGVTILLLLFFYIYGLYEIVVHKKSGKDEKFISRQKWTIVFCFFVGFLCELIIPIAIPHPNGFILGPQGPWCGIQSLLGLVILFYGPTIPFSILSIALAIKVTYTVYATTRGVKGFKNDLKVAQVSSTPTAAGSVKSAPSTRVGGMNKIQRFYSRVSLYVIFYSVATCGSFVKRIIELTKSDWDDINHVNNPTMGLSILLLLLCLFQSLVFLSLPFCQMYWRPILHLPNGDQDSKSHHTNTANTGFRSGHGGGQLSPRSDNTAAIVNSGGAKGQFFVNSPSSFLDGQVNEEIPDPDDEDGKN